MCFNAIGELVILPIHQSNPLKISIFFMNLPSNFPFSNVTIVYFKKNSVSVDPEGNCFG